MSLRPLDTVSKTSSSALALASQREGGSSAESAALWISPVWVHLSPAPAFLPRREQPYFQAQGDLRISNDGLTFASLSSGEAKGLAGFALSPTAVALHALSSSLPDSLPKNLSSSALYIMIDEHPEKDDDDGEEDDEAGPTELWIALDLLEEGKVNVQGAFDALSEAVRSHSAPPAPEDDAKEEYEQEEEEGTFDDASDDDEEKTDPNGLSAKGQRTLNHLESIIEWPADLATPSPTRVAGKGWNSIDEQGTGKSLGALPLGTNPSFSIPTLAPPATEGGLSVGSSSSGLPKPTGMPPLTTTSAAHSMSIDPSTSQTESNQADVTADLTEGALDDADEEDAPTSWAESKAKDQTKLAPVPAPAPAPAPASVPVPAPTRTPSTKTVRPSPVLIFTGLPAEFFELPRLGKALLDLLHAHGELRRYVPLPAHGRAIVVYAHSDSAARAKSKLDRLFLPFEGDGRSTPDPRQASLTHSSSGQSQGLTIRAYFGQAGDEHIWAPLPTATTDESNHLQVPPAERNFLISPPGSPPVGWEPIVEDAPNKDTLADDLIMALGRLRDIGGIAFADNDHSRTAASDDEEESHQHHPLGSPTSTPPPERKDGSFSRPEVPSVRIPSLPPGHARPDGEPQLLIPPSEGMPGVQVSFALNDDQVVPAQGAPTHSISSVKATVDAFYASHGSHTSTSGLETSTPSVVHRPPTPTPPRRELDDGEQRIFPTARPPLELRDPEDDY